MNTNIKTTLGQLCTAYGIECPADPRTTVTLWKGEDDSIHEGWHITTTPDLELIDDQWAPSDDAHASDIAQMLAPMRVTDRDQGDVTNASANVIALCNPYYVLVDGDPLPVVLLSETECGETARAWLKRWLAASDREQIKFCGADLFLANG